MNINLKLRPFCKRKYWHDRLHQCHREDSNHCSNQRKYQRNKYLKNLEHLSSSSLPHQRMAPRSTQEASSLAKYTLDYDSTTHTLHRHHFTPRRNLCKYSLIIYSRYPFVLAVHPKSQENQCSRLHCLAVCTSSAIPCRRVSILSYHPSDLFFLSP